MTVSIVEFLIEKKIISEDDIKKYIESKATTSLWEYLNLIEKENETLHEISNFLNIPFAELSQSIIDQRICQKIPENFAREHNILPLYQLGEILTVAFDDPFKLNIIEELETMTKFIISPVLSTKKLISDLIGPTYSYQEQSLESQSGTMSSLYEMGLELFDDKNISEEETTDLAHEAPIAKLVDTIITQAINEKASDIHIEPEESLVKIRYRVDGLLKDLMSPPKKLASPIISRLKILSNMDITETRKPQDGRLTFSFKGKDIDFRVSTVRTINGEKMVMRMLDKSGAFVSMENLGLQEKEYITMDSMIYSSSGIIVVCGPTGSGKTSTLYSCLSKINTEEKNIITIEDPVEFNLEGINQIPVNPKIGMDFVSGLTSVVRQDPDVIMIGEIRDIETASIAIQAALTGHLVFTTLHTRNAPGSVTRLIDMGIQPFLINSAFIGVIGQRLVRVICPNCKKEQQKDSITSTKELILMQQIKEKNSNFKLHKGAGCKYCDEKGYKGRTGIFEILVLTEEIRDLISKKASSEQIKLKAIENGMKTMKDDGILKIINGITTIEEIARVLDV